MDVTRIDGGEWLEQTKPLREYIQKRYGDGAIAVIKPHDILVYAFKLGVTEANSEFCPRKDNS